MSIDKIFHIMKKDSKAIFKNPAVVITIIAIIILPSLYALLNIDACWDPYGNTDNLDFAVVNNDQNATYNNASYNFGDKVIDKLEDNDDFAWDFVDEDDARDGVENGTYYAAIIIPENFSSNLLSINDQNPKQAQLTYLINEKTNPVASRMSNNAVNQIQSKINDEVIQTVNGVAFNQLSVMGQTTPQSSLSQLSYMNSSGVDNYFYSPTEVTKEKINPVDNYGSEVSPFYIVLSIWVGCVISVALIKARYLGESLYKPLELYFGRMGLFLVIGLLQSTVTIIGAFWLGIEVSNPGLFIGCVYLITIAFMVLIYSLLSLFGNGGKALAIIMLVLQISTTNGIYPVYVMNDFFQALNPYLPMTYAIGLLRNALLGVYWPTFFTGVYAMIAMIIATLLVTIIIKEKFDNVANKFEQALKDSGLF